MRILTIFSAFWLVTVYPVAQLQVTWVEPSPHSQRLVLVEPGVSVEVLDWGGSGPAIVLLAQLGQSAHIYDDWAPTLAREYRVVGISRRGYGGSSVPLTGYTAERLGSDIVAVLDAENLRSVVLVGNGFAGEELSWIGARFPNRVAGLVYLDAAYDRSNLGAEGAAIARRIPPPDPPGPQDFESVQSLTKWMSRRVSIPESEVRQLVQIGQDGRVTGERTPAAVRQQILDGIAKADYPSIRVPAVGIYARPISSDSRPGCGDSDDAAVRQACSELYAWTLQHLSDSQRLFRTIRSSVEVVELPGANSPFVFLSNEREVRSAIDEFVSTLK